MAFDALAIQGFSAVGASATLKNPVVIGGTDGTNVQIWGVDSSNQGKINLTAIVGTAAATAAAGVLKVGIVGGTNTSLETTAGVLDHNLKNVANAAVATAASGVQKVGIVGNTGAAVDFAGQNAAQPANSILIAGEFNTAPTTITNGNASPLQLTAAANLKTDITTIAGTAPTTPGFIDIKGADGNVFVRQATAANLNATVVGTKTNNAAAPGTNNVGALIAVANAAAPTWVEGNEVLASVDLAGNLRVSGTSVATPNFKTRSDTYVAAGNGTTVDVSAAPVKIFSIEVKGTGASATSWQVVLEGSLDNVNFTTILNHVNTFVGDGQVLYSGAALGASLYFRSRCVSVVLGGATNIVVTILGMN
jgi:hypothetical protein